jgi:hypothetical protein
MFNFGDGAVAQRNKGAKKSKDLKIREEDSFFEEGDRWFRTISNNLVISPKTTNYAYKAI